MPCCSSGVIYSLSQKCPGLDDKLYGAPLADTFDRFHYILPIDKINNENIKTLEKQAKD